MIAFRLATARDEGAVLRALERRFRTLREPSAQRHVVLHDTFDWRLQREGETIASGAGDGLDRLRWLAGDGSVRFRADAHVPRFGGELGPGPFRDALLRRIEMRCLLPVVRLELRTRALRLLNEDDKTVARVVFDRGRAMRGDGSGGRRRLPPAVTIHPCKGYEAESAGAARFLGEELGLAPAPGGWLRRGLAAARIEPVRVSTRVAPRLRPGMPCADAMREILRRLLATLAANEDGLRRDLDSEFLHDFRVSVRRARSALGQIKRVFAPQRARPLRDGLKWLGGVTGPTRDLDVYLLKMPRYREGLPAELQADLEPLQVYLRRRQREEHAGLGTALDGARYRRLVERWKRLAAEAPGAGGSGPDAARPVLDVAARRIDKVRRRVLRLGRRLEDASPAADFHRLRIECKKLRYLLEFFGSLFPGNATAGPTKALKRLQTHLGELNDLAVQQQQLERFAESMAGLGVAGPRTLVAVGRLVERLRRQEQAERSRFEARFRAFARGGLQRRFAAALEPRDGG